MKVLFAGTPDVAVHSLNALVDAGFDVVGVLTREDAPVGRKKDLTPSVVAQRAAELGLNIIKANRMSEDVAQQIRQLAPDVAAVVAFGVILPKYALEIPRLGWINLHFSLLPAWRGAAPVQHAIMNGDDITGASTFRIDEGLDTGEVFGTLTESIRPEDTAGELLGRLAESGAVLLTQTLSGLDAGALTGVPQRGDVSLAPKISLEDARVDWKAPALVIRRRINGVTPAPGAWTTLGEQRFKISDSVPAPDVRDLAPGEVRVDGSKKARVVVGTGSYGLELITVQPPGKKMMAASDWARGLGAENVRFEA
ncbi:methionyl-tRNA formyltransferase [Neomicrococcus aestuarii]|uniref:Methionyl-tRNA formyltransferase n=1 Tax=Neomicrococcus aestuarii TaxID=556325 RepID=A0A7W8TXN0_9MICC|nr:methionyl-tRNA formyltransferase [Neomicrococcus aestuarii]MBB5513838.1 methionyl-tRNA formyltransferase [Neomicrococcus aestuarii]